MTHRHRLNRRDFLKIGGVALGGATLAACKRGTTLTAVPTPTGRAALPAPTLAPGQAADAILVNGNIATMDARRSTAQALAVVNGLIVSVGNDDAVRAMAGEATQIIDLRGRTVTPGLNDAHCHLSACGLLGTAYVDVSFPAIKTVEEMQAKVAERIAQTPAGEWVVGSGWVTFSGR
jgi:hypothetical protein